MNAGISITVNNSLFMIANDFDIQRGALRTVIGMYIGHLMIVPSTS